MSVVVMSPEHNRFFHFFFFTRNKVITAAIRYKRPSGRKNALFDGSVLVVVVVNTHKFFTRVERTKGRRGRRERTARRTELLEKVRKTRKEGGALRERT